MTKSLLQSGSQHILSSLLIYVNVVLVSHFLYADNAGFTATASKDTPIEQLSQVKTFWCKNLSDGYPCSCFYLITNWYISDCFISNNYSNVQDVHSIAFLYRRRVHGWWREELEQKVSCSSFVTLESWPAPQKWNHTGAMACSIRVILHWRHGLFQKSHVKPKRWLGPQEWYHTRAMACSQVWYDTGDKVCSTLGLKHLRVA